jgi:hypothetical protein
VSVRVTMNRNKGANEYVKAISSSFLSLRRGGR